MVGVARETAQERRARRELPSPAATIQDVRLLLSTSMSLQVLTATLSEARRVTAGHQTTLQAGSRVEPIKRASSAPRPHSQHARVFTVRIIRPQQSSRMLLTQALNLQHLVTGLPYAITSSFVCPPCHFSLLSEKETSLPNSRQVLQPRPACDTGVRKRPGAGPSFSSQRTARASSASVPSRLRDRASPSVLGLPCARAR